MPTILMDHFGTGTPVGPGKCLHHVSEARNNPLYKRDSWNWLYSRLAVCIRRDGVNFDCSDSGMVIYMLTGEEKTSPAMAREIMENPVPKIQ